MAIDHMVEGALRAVKDAIHSPEAEIAGERHNLANHAGKVLTAIDHNVFDDPWVTIADENTVAFSPTTAGGQPLLMNGKTTSFFPRDQIFDAVIAFRAAVGRGEFDDQLISGGQPTVSPKIEGEQVPADPDNGSLTTGGGRTDADEIATRQTENIGVQTAPE